MMWIYCFESLRLDDFVKCEKMNPLIKKCLMVVYVQLMEFLYMKIGTEKINLASKSSLKI